MKLHRDVKLTNIFIGESFILLCPRKDLQLNHVRWQGRLQRFVRLSSKFSKCVLMGCVVGDFGLATSSLAAVDPSDVSPVLVTPDADMTLGMIIFRAVTFFGVY